VGRCGSSTNGACGSATPDGRRQTIEAAAWRGLPRRAPYVVEHASRPWCGKTSPGKRQDLTLRPKRAQVTTIS
jgi:hypothetical protein